MRQPRGSLRIFPEVRSLHIDDLNDQSPRPTLFLTRYYEASGRELPADWEQVTRFQALIRIWRSPPESLELFEPLWFAFFWFWTAVAVTHRVRTLGKDTRRVFFAIENNDLEALVPHGRRLGGLPTRLRRGLLAAVTGRLIDRVAYGTEASERLYAQFVDGPKPETELIRQLRAPRLTEPPAKHAGSVAFVGVLHERKGLALLLRAWDIVEAADPSAQLTVVGDGPLKAEVERWVAERPAQRRFLGRIERSDVIELLTESSVLAVPSQRWGHWREQVNEAIQEALSVGCTAVTTEETGLADWLRTRGHTIVGADVGAEALGERLLATIRSPLDPGSVLASLPERDGRVLADLWLHAGAR